MNSIISEKTSLKQYNSWRVGGEAEFFSLPKTVEELKEVLLWADDNEKPVTVIGGGSNILISDRGVEGLVVCTRKLTGIEDVSTEDRFRISCKAGTAKLKVMRKFLKEELAPSLFLSGLPGDVAGGVVMNAGVSEKNINPREFVDVVESFQVLKKTTSGYQVKKYNKDDVVWSYRTTTGWKPGVIVEVTLGCDRSLKLEGVKEAVKKAQELRASKQPLHLPSCGSVFRNPYDDPKNVDKKSAGHLIEQAGLKGYQYGGVEISRRHANFIVNSGEGSALDLHCAISIAKNKVKHLFGVELKTEVQYIGNWEGVV